MYQFSIIEENVHKQRVGKGCWNADKDLLVIPVPPDVVRGRVGIPGVVEQVHSKSGAFRHIVVTVTVQPFSFQGVKQLDQYLASSTPYLSSTMIYVSFLPTTLLLN